MSFEIEIADVFVAASLGIRLGSNPTILIGPKASIPTDSRSYIYITGTGGSGPEATQANAAAYRRPGAQCIAITPTASATWNLAEAMWNAITPLKNVTLNGTTWYVSVTQDQDHFDFPLDGAGRPRRGFNISADKRP